ncbi:ABC transporter substrate-binding protein [Nocardioides sp. Iso805N]|uniref:ABC transporter substrate-binding protein n=1 Tax=Nocardioides sp. Iso805N TaxID=1283287 RepID=UPI00037D7AED|nr:ABC transporter substrate-binding protein [Nocardioides sp. Iso805N]
MSLHPITATSARRSLTAAGAVLLAGTLTAGLTGCSGGGNDSSGPSGKAVSSIGADQVTTGTASKPVAAVTWDGGYRAPVTLDPIGLADYPEETTIPNMCEPLIRVEPDYSLKPGLATSWKYADAHHLVVNLRSGVKFWDGKPMTAADVAYSIGRNLDPKYASNYYGSFAMITDVKATGPSQVTLTMKNHSISAVDGLATLGAAVVEKAFAQNAGRSFGSPKVGVMCTGPFAFESYDGTSKLVMKKNPTYWDSAHAALAATFTLVYPTDPQAIVNGLTSGSIQGAFTLPSNLIAALQNAGSGKIYIGQKGSTPINDDLLFTKETGPTADPRLRQALSEAIDRSGIATSVFHGAADPLYKVSGPGVFGYEKETYQAAYDKATISTDVADAAAKVKASGVGKAPIVFGYPSGDSESQQIATVVQQEAQQIGLNLKITAIPIQQYGSLFSSAKARAPYDLILTKNYIELPEPAILDQLVASKYGTMNFSGYDDPTASAALAQADATDDPTARAQLVLKAEDQMATGLPAIPIVQPRAVVFENDALTGATLTFSYMTSPWAAAIGGK